MNRWVRTLFAGLSALALAACSTTPTAEMDFDPAYDSSGVRAIAIQPILRTPASQAVLSDMQINRARNSIAAELTRHGFEVVENGKDADMLLAWHLVTQERTDVRTFDRRTRYRCWNCRGGTRTGTTTEVMVRQYTQGAFIVDMIDPERLEAVWRSVVESRMTVSSNAERAAEQRDATVEAALAGFPPG